MLFLAGTTGLFIMSDETKATVRVFFWLFIVVGVMFSPFAYQDYVMHICKQEFASTKEAGNCYWQEMYGSDIYE